MKYGDDMKKLYEHARKQLEKRNYILYIKSMEGKTVLCDGEDKKEVLSILEKYGLTLTDQNKIIAIDGGKTNGLCNG